jgi:hypothetical protein
MSFRNPKSMFTPSTPSFGAIGPAFGQPDPTPARKRVYGTYTMDLDLFPKDIAEQIITLYKQGKNAEVEAWQSELPKREALLNMLRTDPYVCNFDFNYNRRWVDPAEKEGHYKFKLDSDLRWPRSKSYNAYKNYLLCENSNTEWDVRWDVFAVIPKEAPCLAYVPFGSSKVEVANVPDEYIEFGEPREEKIGRVFLC